MAVLLQDPETSTATSRSAASNVENVETGARELMDALSQRYIGKPTPRDLGPDGVILMIKPARESVFSWSAD